MPDTSDPLDPQADASKVRPNQEEPRSDIEELKWDAAPILDSGVKNHDSSEVDENPNSEQPSEAEIE